MGPRAHGEGRMGWGMGGPNIVGSGEVGGAGDGVWRLS